MPRRYSGRIGRTRPGGTPFADAAAQIEVRGRDDRQRQHQHHRQEEAPSRPAEQAGGDQAQAGDDRDRRDRHPAAHRGDEPDAHGQRERRDQAETDQRDPRATRAGSSPWRPPNARYRPTPSSGEAGDDDQARAKQEVGGLSAEMPATPEPDDDRDGGHPRLVGDPRRLTIVTRQERPERRYSRDPDPTKDHRRA